MSKWIISLLAFLIYAGISEYIYLCPITGAICSPDKAEVETKVEEEVPAPPTIEEVALAPILFNWEDPLAVTTNSFTDAYQQSIMQGNSPDSVLEITGFYSPDEINNTDYENLGRARAARISELFPDIPADQVELLARKVNSPSENPGEAFEFSEMRWVARDDGSNTEETKIVALADREIIYFPFNSTTRIQNPKLEEYLSNLATQLKESGDAITLTGHTDDVGAEENNEALGRSRANSIRGFLVKQGVPASQITVLSEGESEPIATNATERGRARNRRVELVRN
ncbi:MAG: OmpA family protein [Bacteroidota bacterium]